MARIELTVISKDQAIKDSMETIGGLSSPSKMPWYSYNLSSGRCITGSILAKLPNTVCSGCYAMKGRYNFNNVQQAMERRYKTIGRTRWVGDFVKLLKRLSIGVPSHLLYFRWHDSGDLQSVEHLRKIVQIAEQLPNIRFWLPTREGGILRDYFKKYGPASYLPWNLCIRVSGVMINTKTPPIQFGLPVSTVHDDDKMGAYATICESNKRGGKCGDCRACWNNEAKWVSYPKH